MENLNYPEFDKLHAGREFADYLLCNGYSVDESFIGAKNQSISFVKGNKKLDYISGEDQTFITELIKVAPLKGWHKINHVSGPHIEGDVLKFAFLCHSLGWVDFNEANVACKDQTGESLFVKIKQQFNSKFEAKQEMNEVFLGV